MRRKEEKKILNMGPICGEYCVVVWLGLEVGDLVAPFKLR